MLTEVERRGALVVVALLLIGTAYDLWRAHAVPPAEAPPAAPAAPTGAPPGPTEGAAPTDGTVAPPVALDLNRASVADLERLPGIGPTLARRIAAHRLAHGPFHEVGELRAVRGIGPRLVARITPLVTVRSPAAGAGAGPEPSPAGQPPRP